MRNFGCRGRAQAVEGIDRFLRLLSRRELDEGEAYATDEMMPASFVCDKKKKREFCSFPTPVSLFRTRPFFLVQVTVDLDAFHTGESDADELYLAALCCNSPTECECRGPSPSPRICRAASTCPPCSPGSSPTPKFSHLPPPQTWCLLVADSQDPHFSQTGTKYWNRDRFLQTHANFGN